MFFLLFQRKFGAFCSNLEKSKSLLIGYQSYWEHQYTEVDSCSEFSAFLFTRGFLFRPIIPRLAAGLPRVCSGPFDAVWYHLFVSTRADSVML